MEDDKLFQCLENYEYTYCVKHKDLHFEKCDLCYEIDEI